MAPKVVVPGRGRGRQRAAARPRCLIVWPQDAEDPVFDVVADEQMGRVILTALEAIATRRTARFHMPIDTGAGILYFSLDATAQGYRLNVT